MSAQYSFVFNSSNLFSYKDVNILVTKQWSETAYRNVTQNVPLLPFEIVYVGAVIALAGMALTSCGVVKRQTPKIISSY